jgi:hypothetical protein
MSIILIIILLIFIYLFSSYFIIFAKIYYFLQIKIILFLKIPYYILYGFWPKEWWQVRKQFTHPFIFYIRKNLLKINQNLIFKLKQLILTRFKKK